ncbi:hypothetical protein F0A16_09410 [Salinicola corii]|uniref:Alpha/beta hydrolase n=1 Tax=Salinicola corii TaxID=2606937 RepID=A0A640WEY1_9GAMM|nr:hypothetical protein [Salinicola corii]KAA0018711.1 hypothetical protein F0A16_09410 [Salinicola corii]
MRVLFALILLGLPWSLAHAASDRSLAEGAGQYTFQDPDTQSDVIVYYYKPSGYTPNTPVVFVLHGLRRNAKEYRDSWMKYAERNGLMVLSPRFSRDPYPGANGYNLGNVFNAKTHRERIGRAKPDELNPQPMWAFTLIERLFTDFDANRDSNNNPTYFLYGHGAGAQFAHRFAMFMPDSRAQEIIVGAAGWYTMPDKHVEWPYGTGGVPIVDDAALKSFFAQPVLLVAGGADTATIQTVMRKTPEAMAQGGNRVERTRNYFDFARERARALGAPFDWELWVLPGVTHSPSLMVPFAASYIAALAR